jgi:hypothetical protein
MPLTSGTRIGTYHITAPPRTRWHGRGLPCSRHAPGARGGDQEALAEAKAETEEWGRLTALAITHFNAGHRTEPNQALAELEAKYFIKAPYQIATVRASRGEVDAAFIWLERGIVERDSSVSQSRCERIFRGLHGDPRWIPLMRKLGFES